ncbi:MAG: prepilin-type N-terminal cleavage/methylation domain-containing protein [Candidatus Eremiobacterota bacterium]
MKKEPGFTLIEILIGVFVFTLLCTAAFLIFSYGLKVSVQNSTRVQMQHNGRIAIERIVTEAKNAAFLPWQSGSTSSLYSPTIPPSPVFIPFINEYQYNPNNISILYFTAPDPNGPNMEAAISNFNYSKNTSYRMVCYYVDPNYDPNGSANGTPAIIRATKAFPSDIISTYFNTNWTLQSKPGNVNDMKNLTSTTNGWTKEAIIQMPYKADSISFLVTHDLKPDYWTKRKTEFQNAGAIYSNQNNIYDPLTFKIKLNLTQYPYGNTGYNKQELTLDSTFQIRTSYY